MLPVVRVGLQPEELSEMFGAGTTPRTALAFKAPIDVHFDILFDHPAAAAHRSDPAADSATQRGGDQAPVVNPLAVA